MGSIIRSIIENTATVQFSICSNSSIFPKTLSILMQSQTNISVPSNVIAASDIKESIFCGLNITSVAKILNIETKITQNL